MADAARALARVFTDNVKLFARIHNTLAKEKAIEDKWRKMPTPQHGRHLSNHVEPEVVQALRDAVRLIRFWCEGSEPAEVLWVVTPAVY